MLRDLLKYLLEGLAVAIAAYYIPRRSVEVKEIILIALSAAAIFAILDSFAPGIGGSARQGAGFGIGLNQVGFGPRGQYGGQNGAPRLSCSCEVDAQYLRGQLCQVHSPPVTAVVKNASGQSAAAVSTSLPLAVSAATVAAGTNPNNLPPVNNPNLGAANPNNLPPVNSPNLGANNPNNLPPVNNPNIPTVGTGETSFELGESFSSGRYSQYGLI